jgi:hypothetical protein
VKRFSLLFTVAYLVLAVAFGLMANAGMVGASLVASMAAAMAASAISGWRFIALRKRRPSPAEVGAFSYQAMMGIGIALGIPLAVAYAFFVPFPDIAGEGVAPVARALLFGAVVMALIYYSVIRWVFSRTCRLLSKSRPTHPYLLDEVARLSGLRIERRGETGIFSIAQAGLTFEVSIIPNVLEWYIFVRDSSAALVWEDWVDYVGYANSDPREMLADAMRDDIVCFAAWAREAEAFDVAHSGKRMQQKTARWLHAGVWRDVWSAEGPPPRAQSAPPC